MTAPTPEQMRALADEAHRFADAHKIQGEMLVGDRYWRMSAALSAAADHLDAVQSRALVRDALRDADYEYQRWERGEIRSHANYDDLARAVVAIASNGITTEASDD